VKKRQKEKEVSANRSGVRKTKKAPQKDWPLSHLAKDGGTNRKLRSGPWSNEEPRRPDEGEGRKKNAGKVGGESRGEKREKIRRRRGRHGGS